MFSFQQIKYRITHGNYYPTRSLSEFYKKNVKGKKKTEYFLSKGLPESKYEQVDY